MKNTIIFFLLLFILSCSDKPTAPEDKNSPTGSVTVGSGGGTLTTAEFELDIPAGAFASDANLILSINQGGNTGFDNIISNEFKLEGLPQSFSQSLKIKLKHSGSLTDGSFIAIGENVWLKSLNAEDECYHLLSAKDSSGYLIATIPPTSDNNSSKSVSMSSPHANGITINILAITGSKSHLSPQGHFKINYPASVQSEAYNLANYLETAYSKFEKMGFSYERRTAWPIEVTVKKLKSTVYGYSINSLWGDNYGYMEFNIDKISDARGMEITSGHEFFHLVQSLYDPRNFYSKAKLKSPHLWLDEAFAVWSEELFSQGSDFISGVFADNADLVINGASQGDGSDSDKYGYGMASFIKFIINKYGDWVAVSICNEIYNGSTPFNAIDNTISDPTFSLWDEFIQQYLTFKLYRGGNFSPAWLIGNATGKFEIQDENDTLKTFSENYSDLSAKIFSVKNQFNDLGEKAQLVFEIPESSQNQILLFKVNSSESVFLQQGLNSETLDKFKEITDAGYIIVAAVLNSSLTSPFTNETTSVLTIRIQDELWFNNIGFSIDCEATFRETTITSSGSVDIEDNEWALRISLHHYYFEGLISVLNNTVTRTANTTDEYGNTYQTNLSITFDSINNPTLITNFNYSSIGTHSDGDDPWKIEESASGINIPFKWNSLIQTSFELSGDISNNLLDIKYKYNGEHKSGMFPYQYESEVISFNASDGTIRFSFTKDFVY